MAEEQGDKNEMISDSDKKMDALLDMMKDACEKMDSGSKRLDARMDAMEENFKRADARMDAMSAKDADDDKDDKKADRKDADDDDDKKEEKKDGELPEALKKNEKKADRKDADDDDDDKKKGETKDPAADKGRKDADDDDDDKDKKEERMADSQYMTRAEATALREEIRGMQARAPAIINDADRERFAQIQEDADPVFQAFNDRAPAPLPGETPTQYKRRLGGKMQAHSPRWKDARLSAVSDEVILDGILDEVYADSMAAARRGADIPKGQLRARERSSGGHTIIEYDGDTESWMNSFAGHSQRATGNFLRPN